MTRKLASIVQIDSIEQIDGADLIEVAMVGGWRIIVNKSDFKIGDKALFFEIDSYLPIRDEFEFLRKSSYKKINEDEEGFRLKTMKLRGVLSQGLLLPIDTFKSTKNSKVGENVTDKLGVKLYEVPEVQVKVGKPSKVRMRLNKIHNFIFKFNPYLAKIINILLCKIFLSKKISGNFPNFLVKSDQNRIQNLSNKLEYLSEQLYEVTIKIDGSSMTVFHNEKDVGVCSRNLRLNMLEDSKYVAVVNRQEIIEKLKDFYKLTKRNIAVQGELFGEGIQGNPEKIIGQDFRIFDIYDIDKKHFVSPSERVVIVEQLGLKHVPIIANNFSIKDMSVDDLLEYAEGESLHSKKREGLVFKAMSYNRFGNIDSFKCIANSYLLKLKD